jgi:hypothetical protein
MQIYVHFFIKINYTFIFLCFYEHIRILCPNLFSKENYTILQKNTATQLFNQNEIKANKTQRQPSA